MTVPQQQALVSLLQDGDAATVGLVKGQLMQGGEACLAEYTALLRQAQGPARESLREVIQEIESARTIGDVSRGLAKLKTLSQLEDICWDFTRTVHPGFEGGPYARQLDEWAEGAAKLISPTASSREKVLCLARYLGADQGLGGSGDDYYHPRNGYLPWAMEFRCGLPITLTLVYILVGQRIGLPVEGIAAPGHFLARLDGIIFDPYRYGRILSDGEWEMIAAEVPVKQRPLLTRACTPMQTMHRLMINLRNCYVKRNDANGRKMVDHYLAVLQR
jgi:hypothetical protein